MISSAPASHSARKRTSGEDVDQAAAICYAQWADATATGETDAEEGRSMRNHRTYFQPSTTLKPEPQIRDLTADEQKRSDAWLVRKAQPTIDVLDKMLNHAFDRIEELEKK